MQRGILISLCAIWMSDLIVCARPRPWAHQACGGGHSWGRRHLKTQLINDKLCAKSQLIIGDQFLIFQQVRLIFWNWCEDYTRQWIMRNDACWKFNFNWNWEITSYSSSLQYHPKLTRGLEVTWGRKSLSWHLQFCRSPGGLCTVPVNAWQSNMKIVLITQLLQFK